MKGVIIFWNQEITGIKPLLALYCPLLEKGEFDMSGSVLCVRRDKSAETLGFSAKLKSSEALHYSTNHPFGG